jgi:hypothetical protein
MHLGDFAALRANACPAGFPAKALSTQGRISSLAAGFGGEFWDPCDFVPAVGDATHDQRGRGQTLRENRLGAGVNHKNDGAPFEPRHEVACAHDDRVP